MIIPTAAAAALAFYAGSQMAQPANASAGETAIAYERVYVPDRDVAVDISESERATEIVLQGLKPIADDLDIVRGETSDGTPPTMMVIQPLETNPTEKIPQNGNLFFF